MKWREFASFMTGLDYRTPLGSIVSIRAEDDPEVLREFNADQKRIRNEWRQRQAKTMNKEKVDNFLEQMKTAFINMAGNKDK